MQVHRSLKLAGQVICGSKSIEYMFSKVILELYTTLVRIALSCGYSYDLHVTVIM